MNKLLELAKTKLGAGYVWGSQGETLTAEKLQWFKNTFGPSHYVFNDNQGTVDASKWIGKQVFDCSGLVLWCLQQLGLIGAKQDYNAEMFYNQLCIPVTKAELKEGDLVFIKTQSGEISHIGIYKGNGDTVEAMSTRYGVTTGHIERFNLFGRLNFKLNVADMDWKAILKEKTDCPDKWIKGLETAINAAKADGNLGDLEIFKFFGDLIEKIHNER
jgi:hypothetical protein